MKLNIFKIDTNKIDDFLGKLSSAKYSEVYKKDLPGWGMSFYLSDDPEVDDIPWVNDFKSIIPVLGKTVKNQVFSAVAIYRKTDISFAITFGKTHHYARPFSDPEFGLEVAKRIADIENTKQTATRRFSGKKKKDIKSFKKNTALNNESGESVDLISAGVIPEYVEVFGDTAKFGGSVLLTLSDITHHDIPGVLDSIVEVLKTAEIFSLPKIVEVKDPESLEKYYSQMVSSLNEDPEEIEPLEGSHEIVGVDFIFAAGEKYTYKLGGHTLGDFDELSGSNFRDFISRYGIKPENYKDIKVEVSSDSRKTHTKKFFEMIDFMIPDQNVVLDNGKWKKFNAEYLDEINDSMDSIHIDPTEPSLMSTRLNEPKFNKTLESYGYENADKNFDILKLSPGYKVEAWDHRMGETVYAVKFGKPQEISYVCSQAIATLEIIRNNASLKKLPNSPKRYCLWLYFTRRVNKISDIKSIILKQQIDAFARKCRELGIEPVIKIGHKIKK